MSTIRGESRLWSLLKQATPVQQSAQPAPARALQDHTLWSDDFGKWALSECLFSDRCFGGVKVMHSRFCDWCNAQGTVGCMLETFEALLEYEGFLVTNKCFVCPDGLVHGLILKEGLAAALFEPPAATKA